MQKAIINSSYGKSDGTGFQLSAEDQKNTHYWDTVSFPLLLGLDIKEKNTWNSRLL